ncbi:MAG TPA: AraC family transcriptional regulator, partial [Ruminococcaceae bacterium]|nr:AraC family transcriptional regulator [Oscillospiraceae bacterium]
QFSRQFKKQTGTSPYDYLLGIRLTKAKELLKNTSLPISEISYQTGFANDSSFIYFFKKHEEISPLKFRNILF